MNGFTSSLHVKGSTAKRVQQAVTELLRGEGFQVLLADDDSGDEQQITRGVWVAKAKGDWVSLFCSDFMFQQEIGRELSKQLQTHTLNVWVTEGSSWHYSLFQNGEELDQFDSSGGDLDFGASLDDGLAELTDEYEGETEEEDDDFAEAVDDDEEAGPIQDGFSRLFELQENFSGKMPADVKEIYDRLTEGKASLGDMRKFDQWSQVNQAELAQFQDLLQQQTAELTATMQGFFQQGAPGSADENAEANFDPASMLQGALPPDIAQMFGRMMSGQMSPGEMQQFAEGLGEDSPDLDEDLKSMTADDGGEEATLDEDLEVVDENDDDDDFADEEQGGFSEEQLQMHLGALRPLLAKNVDQDELADTLTSDDEAPEAPLGEFLSALGIESALATYDFDLLEQTSDEDLNEVGIQLSPLLLVRSSPS
ncbi:hypothetical protein [Anatilimnocola floriformis]|uniref:hypothetical protein n=1 Tax=Anatilimnocola floriformis TaxID=2948575 RepID=UPI0020C28D26|nr:hypothetical protein [Anatilimnocola floriformis]